MTAHQILKPNVHAAPHTEVGNANTSPFMQNNPFYKVVILHHFRQFYSFFTKTRKGLDVLLILYNIFLKYVIYYYTVSPFNKMYVLGKMLV